MVSPPPLHIQKVGGNQRLGQERGGGLCFTGLDGHVFRRVLSPGCGWAEGKSSIAGDLQRSLEWCAHLDAEDTDVEEKSCVALASALTLNMFM